MSDEKINLNMKEAAEQLGVSVPVLYRLIREEPDFPSLRIGRRRLVNRRLLMEWSEREAAGGGYG